MRRGVNPVDWNPVDWKAREGYLEKMRPELPLIVGWDVSGLVETRGAGVTRLKQRDEVYSRPDLSRNGAYAEYIVVKESEVALKPKSIDHIHAAAIPLAALTAWQSLFDAAQLKSGQSVLILLVSDVIRTNEMQVWFLSEHLVEVPLVRASA